MPMPHRTQMQVIKRRLVGKDGAERVRELRAILAELPNYKSGPYADIRKWLNAELAATRTRARVVHRDSLAVRREGAAQIALVGAPNVGKSSLLQALSQVQIKTGDYAFTTTRPAPALTRVEGVLVQLVEIPGLIAGARAGRGGGRALLSVLRGADAMVLCHDASAPFAELETVRAELAAASISLRTIVAATRADEAPAGAVDRLRAALELEVVPVSVLDDASIEAFRAALWRLTGLVRVFLRSGGEIDREPIALRPPATAADAARAVHGDLARRLRGARVWGASARFDGQRVGAAHELCDGDVVELLAPGAPSGRGDPSARRPW
ncbi:MAG: 50S ribosome-binding GTPase [Thermoleophilia bacterium]|nr:50S ribosome-binding GTPase [Thermoleophilia bacterium]